MTTPGLTRKSDKELKHFGVIGMRWGIRANSDGTITTRRQGKDSLLSTTCNGITTPINVKQFSSQLRAKFADIPNEKIVAGRKVAL